MLHRLTHGIPASNIIWIVSEGAAPSPIEV
jgi:hypothetical protein